MKNLNAYFSLIDIILASTIKVSLSSSVGIVTTFMPVWYHQIVVAEYVREIALAIGYSDIVSKRLFIAGLFHDISKVTWGSNLHIKPYRFLSQEEKEKIKQHPKESVEILMSRNLGKHKKLLMSGNVSVIDIITYHHEKPDGSGYYHKKDVPKEIALLSIADMFDACTENRPYRIKPMTPEEAAKLSTEIFMNMFSEDEILVVRRELIELLHKKNLYKGFFDAEFVV